MSYIVSCEAAAINATPKKDREPPMSQSKFVEGMRVAKVSGFSGHSHTEAFVEKVHKNGNFTLKGDETRQQWKPDWSGTARKTGKTSHYPTKIYVWDETFDVAIAKEKALRDHKQRAYALETKVRGMELKWLSHTDLADLEALIERINPTPKEGG